MALDYHEIKHNIALYFTAYRPKDCLVEQQISTYQN